MGKEQNNQMGLRLASFVSIGFLVFIVIFAFLGQRQLKKEPVYCIGIVVRTYNGTRNRDFVRYEFNANGRVYVGDQQYFPQTQSIEIGDTCEVVYARTNPEINRLLKNENNTLKVKRKRRVKKDYFLEWKKHIEAVDSVSK